MIKILSINMAFLFLYSCQTGQESKQIETNTFHTIPFTLTSHNNLSIKAIVNKTDTVELMFHTATNSITLTTEVIKRLSSINWSSEEAVKSWGGESSARYSKSNSISIADLNWDSIPIWETQNSGPTTEGKFGPNLFAAKVIEIDFDKSVMLIHDSLPKGIQKYVKVPLEFEDDNMFIVGTSEINGTIYENRFLIHSGYGGTILFGDKLAADSKIGEHIEIIAEKELKDSYGNVIKTKKGILPVFTIGKERFEKIPAGFFEGTIGRQQMSVLGGDLIKRFNIILDAEREFIYLKTNSLRGMGFTDFK